ncbi:MAG: amidohydrolase family protein [Chloroflexi bacterium]|jgi:imidazolonepropionase-like amidohydrolase|nr:amidohydrolase family protein [Chloroflexota bacterium]
MATVAIVGGTLIDGTGADPVSNTTLIIENDTITSIGPASQANIPAGATVIDAAGMTIMPGLIDCHVHLALPGGSLGLTEAFLTSPSLGLLGVVPNSKATLEAGVTTARDTGMAPAGVRQAIERKMFPGPRLLVAISPLSQSGGHVDGHLPSCVDRFAGLLPDVPSFVVDGPDEMRKRVREILRAGADWIKMCTTGGVLSPADDPSHTQFTIEEIAAAVYEAAAQGKKVCAHAQGTQGIKNALLAGVESIEHGIWLDDEAIEIMKSKKAYLVATLIAPLSVLEAEERNPGSVPPYGLQKAKHVIKDHYESFRKAVEGGVNIAMGTDAGVGPHGENARELDLMVQYGMTPMQSIVTSTLNAAKLLRLDKRLGTLETGKLGDVLVVDGDPLADIKVLQDKNKLVAILKGGEVYKDLTGNRVLALG